jgi:S1-C subfamily serine protease
MKKLHLLALSAAFVFLFSCTSTQTGDSASTRDGGRTAVSLSAKTLQLVEEAVFEVVMEKPKDDPLVYEKELDWDLVPYAIRTDDYYSIGTAFAISETEFITAFHVINLGYTSMVNNRYHIRDSRGRVYEVDQVIAGSNERDFLIFTAKGRTNEQYFQFERNFRTGDPVLSIGNALGEGIVVRGGLILGTVPEEEAGRWNQLKSSADGNPGNSGGPLVTPEGKVVGVAVGLRDNNILYSVPAEVVLDFPRDKLAYRIRPSYSHLILANTGIRVFETAVSLPDDYLSVNRQVVAAYDKDYVAAMEGLFNTAPAYLDGPNNVYLLDSVISSSFPELDFVSKDDDNWHLSDLDVKSYNLPDDGRLIQASISSFSIYKINRPKSAPLASISTDPRYILDLMLQNMRMERTLWGNQKYRILSFGDPSSVSEYRDALGRSWIAAHWLIGFDDKVLFMYILPLPNGPAVVMTIQNSSFFKIYEWDIRKTCDHIHAAYVANFDEWDDFIALGRYIPDFLKDFNFSWQEDTQRLAFSYPGFSLEAGPEVFDWNNTSELFLGPSYYNQDDEIEFGIRKVILQRDVRGREYAILYKNIKPDSRLGAKAAESWADLVEAKYPFDGNPGISAKDNTGSIGAMLGAARPNPDIRYSLYLSMENPQGEDNLRSRMDALKNGIMIER